MFGRLVCGLVLVMTPVPGPPCSLRRLRSSSAIQGAAPRGEIVRVEAFFLVGSVMVRPRQVGFLEGCTIAALARGQAPS